MRFKNFYNDWEETRLDNQAMIVDGTHQTPDYKTQGVKFVSVENIKDPYLTNKFVSREDYEQFKVKPQIGDIFMTRITAGVIGETYVIDKKDDLAYYVSLALIRPKDNINSNFLSYYINSSYFKHSLDRRIIKVAFPRKINLNDIGECPIKLCDVKEQEKIASFLELIDQRIVTQIKIINNLEFQKNYIINKLIDNKNSIFCISELMHIGRGRVISNNELDKIEDGKYPVYSSQTSNNGIMGYLNTFDFDGEYITWTTDGANAGTVYYRNGKFNCTNVCGTLKSKNDNVDLFYVAQILPLFTKKYVSINLANPKLMNNVMGNIKIPLPSINIQKQHSNIIKKLTDKIETETQILNNLKLQKNYLLNNLFI